MNFEVLGYVTLCLVRSSLCHVSKCKILFPLSLRLKRRITGNVPVTNVNTVVKNIINVEFEFLSSGREECCSFCCNAM